MRPSLRVDRERRSSDEGPIIPDDVSADQLDQVTRNSLQTLPEGLAEYVAKHLVAAERVIESDPELALAHTLAAARRAGRVAVVREAAGIAAYSAGEYAKAASELRAAARISGSVIYLPMIADCERGLGRPERALELAGSAEAARLDRSGKVEMLIVAAGARRDLGQVSAAVLTLQVPALKAKTDEAWLARLRYAYADALLADNRRNEALEWFRAASEVDAEAVTDAQERVDELQGVIFSVADLDVDGQSGDGPIAGDDGTYLKGAEG